MIRKSFLTIYNKNQKKMNENHYRYVQITSVDCRVGKVTSVNYDSDNSFCWNVTRNNIDQGLNKVKDRFIWPSDASISPDDSTVKQIKYETGNI